MYTAPDAIDSLTRLFLPCFDKSPGKYPRFIDIRWKPALCGQDEWPAFISITVPKKNSKLVFRDIITGTFS